jgi:hypothetical protein
MARPTMTEKAKHYELTAEAWRSYAWQLEEKLKNAHTVIENTANNAAFVDSPKEWTHESRVRWGAIRYLLNCANNFTSKKPLGNFHP